MDPRVYGGPRPQGQQGQGPKGRQQQDPSGQGGRRDDSYSPRGQQSEDSYSRRGKQEDLFQGQRGTIKQDDAFGQRGKQEDLFAQRASKQDDPYAQRGKREDQFDKRRTETSLRVQGNLQRYPNESFEGPNRPGSQVRGGEGGGRNTLFGDFASGSTEPENSLPDQVQYSSVEGEAELHGTPGSEFMHNPTVQTMVKMVTMLNFMKVELGETKTLKSKEQWRAAGAEFIGTLLFVFLGCGSVVATGMLYPEMTPARLIAIAIAHGLAISCLAGATGAISGGHLNPAVTLAFVVAGKENLVRAGLYASAQLLGAIFGAILLQASTPAYMRGTLGSHDINRHIFTSQAFLMEMVLTFALVFVIFGVAVDRRGPGVIAPIPIGFAVLVDHLVGVPYTGASMNPARSFGPALVSGYFGNAHLLYWVAPCFGATLASALYRHAFLEPAEAAARAAAGSPPH